MIPSKIKYKLFRLRIRERILDLVCGASRWLALTVGLLLLACLIDWAIDRERETPLELRRFLSYFQIAVAICASFLFLLWPFRKRLTDSSLALRVEEKFPQLKHRLISAVELNKRHTKTQGMSRELIAVVTKEAVEQTRGLSFAEVADKRRLTWGAALLIPVLALTALPFLLWPQTAATLLARQMGDDRDIPRDVSIEPMTAEVWPSGEKVVLQFKVKGSHLDTLAGAATIRPVGQPSERFPLELDKNWQKGDAETIVRAELPPSATNFTYTAWLGDGRTKKPSPVRYEPRPVITEQIAWVQYPDFCGLRPDGSRYEQLQSHGDVQGIAGSSARVAIKIQKPIEKGLLEILGPEKVGADISREEIGPEIVKRTLSLQTDGNGTWQGTFSLKPDETGYRIVVADQYGFANVPPPRRNLSLIPEETPHVAMLKEQFPPSLRTFVASSADDFVVEGLPLPLGGSIPVSYTANGPYGLGQARFLFRVLKKVESGNDDPGEEKWLVLPLQEIAGNAKAGPFDPRIGAFENSGPKDQIYFHAIPDGLPFPRTLGGGRFDFKTTGIPDGKGGMVKLKVGDQIEYCIEVFADKNGKTDRPSARSETRVKTVVSFTDLERWLSDNLQEAQRIRQLDSKQRGLFEDK